MNLVVIGKVNVTEPSEEVNAWLACTPGFPLSVSPRAVSPIGNVTIATDEDNDGATFARQRKCLCVVYAGINAMTTRSRQNVLLQTPVEWKGKPDAEYTDSIVGHLNTAAVEERALREAKRL